MKKEKKNSKKIPMITTKVGINAFFVLHNVVNLKNTCQNQQKSGPWEGIGIFEGTSYIQELFF